MRKLLFTVPFAVFLLVPHLSHAQTAPAPEMPTQQESQQAEPPATDKEVRPRRGSRRGASATGKRAECRDQARAKGLAGLPMRDAALICYQEARLDCLKKAVADGIAPRERREHIAECLGEEPRKRGAGRGQR